MNLGDSSPPIVLRKLRKQLAKAQKATAAAVGKGLLSGSVEAKARPVEDASLVASKAKLDDNDAEDFKHPQLTHEFKVALMRARQAKGLTQQQLAQAVAVKASVVQDYETGRAIPNPAIIAKLKRALGVPLPRPQQKRTKKTAVDSEEEGTEHVVLHGKVVSRSS